MTMDPNPSRPVARRSFLTQAAGASLTLASLGPNARASGAAQAGSFPRGTAEHCILLWLGGGACHIDTWDPKRRGDPRTNKPGSYYDAIDTAVAGLRVCQHLPLSAQILDRCNLIRTLHHDVIDEHAAAVNRLHTGRPATDSTIYPSIGSIVAQQLGPMGDAAPAYVLIGYPNVTRGPGFLGAKHGYLYLTDTRSGPEGLARPAHIAPPRQARRDQLLAALRCEFVERTGHDRKVQQYDAMIGEAGRLASPEFMSVFQLDRESASLRARYGGEFGQRCLLARRLVESGVRFVEVSHNLNFVNGTGWDTHNRGQVNQHLLIRELDSALASLVLDLEKRNLLDKTLVVVATEFGRPAHFDAGGGRGHHAQAFSAVLAGGGLKSGQVIGQTDALGMKIISRPVSVPDLHATICACLGIDPAQPLFDGERPVPITDGGQPMKELFGGPAIA